MNKQSLSLLLVDDHDDTLRVMSKLLAGQGYTVHSARSTKEALALAAARKCDLLVSDVGLPDGSGIELMRELRALYGLKGIAVSGFTTADDIQAAMDVGFAKHLPKPVRFADLLLALKELS